MSWPRIVADALVQLDDHAAAWSRPFAGGSPDAVREHLRRAASPGRSSVPPPPFLLPHQVDAWRRVMHALRAWHGAVLAEPVGHGKSWIAAATVLRSQGPATVIVPSILAAQWAAVVNDAQVAISIWTHERISRGALPPGDPRLVVVDEAHRFRNPATRRTQLIAPWLVGRDVLLLTATPIVNRTDDLIALLRLFASDDALALDGVANLGAITEFANPPPSLRRLVIRSAPSHLPDFTRRAALLAAGPAECARAAQATSGIAALSLSRRRSVRQLLRTVLLDAAASSDAAMVAALRRYRALLLQSRDSGGLTRAALRQFSGSDLDQTVLWPMIGGEADDAGLPQSDLPLVEAMLERLPADEAWITVIAPLITDEVVTVCFARHRATADALRQQLGDSAAWVNGMTGGIGPHRLDRDLVLSAFGPLRANWSVRRRQPDILIATDVAAEGLDLQAAGRVIHLDLPWTAVRLAQREGRLLRLGQQHAAVDVLMRRPAPAIVAALHSSTRLRTKLGSSARWLRSLAVGDPEATPESSVLVATAHHDIELDAVVIIRAERGDRAGLLAMRRTPGGEWSIEAGGTDWIHSGMDRGGPEAADAAWVAQAVRSACLAAVATCQPGASGDRELVQRIHRLARAAAVRRDEKTLTRLDRLLRFVTTSPTPGLRVLFERLRTSTDEQFVAADLPLLRERGTLVVVPVAVIRVECGRGTLPFGRRATTLRR